MVSISWRPHSMCQWTERVNTPIKSMKLCLIDNDAMRQYAQVPVLTWTISCESDWNWTCDCHMVGKRGQSPGRRPPLYWEGFINIPNCCFFTCVFPDFFRVLISNSWSKLHTLCMRDHLTEERLLHILHFAKMKCVFLTIYLCIFLCNTVIGGGRLLLQWSDPPIEGASFNRVIHQ